MKKILISVLTLLMFWTVIDKHTFGNGSRAFPFTSMYILEDENTNRKTIVSSDNSLVVGDWIIIDDNGIQRIGKLK